MPTGYFITGTDTGVGKTFIASAIVREFATRGLRTAGMKPVAAGCDSVNGVLLSDDVAKLMAASNVNVPLSLINPYAFAPPVAPHIAAVAAGIEIDLSVIKEAYLALADFADVIIVEGVGGFSVPLNSQAGTADLAQQLGLPVILVVGMRLGCINHALLTVEAIQSRGLKLDGWIANCIDAQMLVLEENLDTLRQRIHAPCLAVVDFDGIPDLDALALPEID